jgi:glucose-6-phosphate isomerase
MTDSAEVEGLKLDPTHLDGVPRPSRVDLELARDRLATAHAGLLTFDADERSAQACLDLAARTPDWAEEVVVLGMGGSALGGRAIVEALGQGSRRRVRFVDSIDPTSFERLLAELDLARTVWNVVSKTGTTVETRSLAAIVWARLWAELGAHRARERVVITTDPSSGPLRAFARAEGVRAFDVPSELPGRFTIFSPVALLPAAWAGVDVMGLLSGARELAARLGDERDPARNPALLAAGATAALAQAGRSVLVLWPYADGLAAACEWARQLYAEGTCKSGRGITTLVARGAAGQHAELQAFAEGPPIHQVRFLAVVEPDTDVTVPPADGRPPSLGRLLDASRRASAELLARRQCPSATLLLPRLDAHSLGELLFFWQIETVLCAYVLGVDPLGEPAVDEIKSVASDYVDRGPGASV